MTFYVPRARTDAEKLGVIPARLRSWCESSDGYMVRTFEILNDTTERFYCEVEDPSEKIFHTTLLYPAEEGAVDVAHVMINARRRREAERRPGMLERARAWLWSVFAPRGAS